MPTTKTKIPIKHSNKKELIKKMNDKILHRGPDSEGIYVDDFVALVC